MYDEFYRQIPANAVVIHLGRSSFYDVYGSGAEITSAALNVRLSAITWNGRQIPHLERLVYPLNRDAAALTALGYPVYLCRRIAGIYHYEPFQPETPHSQPPVTDKRPAPPRGYTRTTATSANPCPVCNRERGRWWGPDGGPGNARIFQDDRAQAMWRKVEEDRDDWRWTSALLFQCGFAPEYVWRLMGSAPIWSDRQYHLDGASLVSHWSRYSVGGCDCGAQFWHDYGSPQHYYVQIPARIEPEKKARRVHDAPSACGAGCGRNQKPPAPDEAGIQLSLF